MSELLKPPRRLEKTDNSSDFSSGADELDDWFRRFAWQNQRANNAVTYVLVHQSVILGYYALATGAVARADVPAKFAERRPNPIPVLLLARLAVDHSAQSRGLGRLLFRDAIERSVVLSQAVGAAALVIHARDDDARSFYLRHADLLESPVDPLQLILPIRDAARVVRSATS